VGEIVRQLVERLRPQGRALSCESYLEGVVDMAHRADWATRQRQILAATGEPAEIVRQLTEQSRISG
jgi:gamma-glutamyl:cysteine ligase YbdK (ATP-grasp superfamily)